MVPEWLTEVKKKVSRFNIYLYPKRFFLSSRWFSTTNEIN